MHETTSAVGEFTESKNFISQKYSKNAFIRACPGLEIVPGFFSVLKVISVVMYICANIISKELVA